MGTPEREAMFAIIYREHLLGRGRHGRAAGGRASSLTEEHNAAGGDGARVFKQNVSLEECPSFVGPSLCHASVRALC